MVRPRWTMVGLGLVVAGAVSLTAGPAFAEHKAGKDPSKHLEHLDKKLDLTDEQRAKVEGVLNDYHARSQALMKQRETLRQEKHEKIKAILTPEQQAKFEKMAQRKHRKHWWSKKDGKDN